jgi:hypothetical protein
MKDQREHQRLPRPGHRLVTAGGGARCMSSQARSPKTSVGIEGCVLPLPYCPGCLASLNDTVPPTAHAPGS